MRHFGSSRKLNPEDEKRAYIERALKEKFSSEMLKRLNEFRDRVAMVMNIVGINLELLFMAYMCYANMGYSVVCDELIMQKIPIPSRGFMKHTVDWLGNVGEVKTWHAFFSNKRPYTIDKFKLDIAFHIAIVTRTIGCTELNIELPDDEVDSGEDSSDDDLLL